MRHQPPWSDNWFRRSWVERAPPLTYRGIVFWALVCAVGTGVAFAAGHGRVAGAGGLCALAGCAMVVRGLFRKAWLAIGGTDQPIRTLIRRRLDD